MVYLHDGTFEGILNAIAIAVKSSDSVEEILPQEGYTAGLFSQSRFIPTDQEQALKLFQYLQTLGQRITALFFHCYLSGDKQCGTHLHAFTKLCLLYGANVLNHHTDDSVKFLLSRQKRVLFEVHRFQGLIRFRILDDELLYGPFEPQYNIIGLLAGHFRRRLASKTWVLHDLSYNLAVHWNGDGLAPITLSDDVTHYVRQHGELPQAMLTSEEKKYQQLWRKFHDSIANDGRQNRRLQQQHMPKLYWKYLVEMNQ